MTIKLLAMVLVVGLVGSGSSASHAKDPWKHYYKPQEKQAKAYYKHQRKQAKAWEKFERKHGTRYGYGYAW